MDPVADDMKNFQQLVEDNGFLFNDYEVTTEDGYKLHLYRIRTDDRKAGDPAVFLQHGFGDSADAFVIHTVDKAPAFQLATAGFDVWLGNQRGSKHSIGHETLDLASEEYWQFTFQEFGEYDAPAMVEKALSVSGVSNLTWIGHS